MSVLNIVPPAELPVSVADQKLYMRVDHDEEDALVESQIKSATRLVEGYLGAVLVTQTLRFKLNSFPPSICLPVLPVQTVTEITYTDPDGVTRTLEPSAYELRERDAGTAVDVLPTAGGFPGTARKLGAVTVDFVAGYGDPAEVPENIREAIKQVALDLYESRGTGGAAITPAVEALLAPDRLRWFG